MKTSSYFTILCFAVTGALLCLTLPLRADPGDGLNQALDLVHKAWNPAGDPPSVADRTAWLTQALKLTINYPNDHLRGHRVAAIKDIREALAELKKGDPNNQAIEHIHDADSELRDATSLAD